MSAVPPVPGFRRLCAALVVVVLALAVWVAWAAGGTAAVAKTSSGATVLGDYATPLVGAADANGVRHIDASTTIAKLQAAHINTYAYLIFDSPLYGTGTQAQTTQAQWNDLPAFATAAAAAGIDVLVYLVPPSETPQAGYQPFGWDYKSWANAVATLAVAHPNIREIAMDDFAANTVEGGSTRAFAFTPAYVSQMMSSARSIASWLTFRPVMYYPNEVGTAAVLPAFRPVVDGIIFPYRAASAGGGFNTTDASAATQQGGVVGAMAKCHSGVRCAQVEWPKNTPSAAGDFGAVSQTVSVGTAATKTLTFWQDDDFSGATSGFHEMQALVDGTVVWQSDVAASSNGLWHQVSVNVTSQLAGKSTATLTLRVWDAQGVSNFHVAGWFDDVSGSGFTVADGGFENASFSPWSVSAGSPDFTVAMVPTLDVDFMTYATKFSTESAPTGTAYVRSVLSQALALVHSGAVDGSIVYSLNLTGTADGRSDPAVYGVVQSLYG